MNEQQIFEHLKEVANSSPSAKEFDRVLQSQMIDFLTTAPADQLAARGFSELAQLKIESDKVKEQATQNKFTRDVYEKVGFALDKANLDKVSLENKYAPENQKLAEAESKARTAAYYGQVASTSAEAQNRLSTLYTKLAQDDFENYSKAVEASAKYSNDILDQAGFKSKNQYDQQMMMQNNPNIREAWENLQSIGTAYQPYVSYNPTTGEANWTYSGPVDAEGKSAQKTMPTTLRPNLFQAVANFIAGNKKAVIPAAGTSQGVGQKAQGDVATSIQSQTGKELDAKMVGSGAAK